MAPDLTDIPQEHRDRLADYIDGFVERWSEQVSPPYLRGLKAAALLVRDGDKPVGLSATFLEVQ